MVTAVGKLWHPEHFVCVHCGESLGSSNYFERNLQPYCERDYHLIFSPKCEACAGPILDVSFCQDLFVLSSVTKAVIYIFLVFRNRLSY